ncbi:MAG: hypothetical protein U9R75_01255, partial [Candidatus Thermoplasmatota archaeon]|nr:hypothetical protein [Candidatus Thermoplasmatota archaeon]
RKKPIEEKTPENGVLEVGQPPSDDTTPSTETGLDLDVPSFDQIESPSTMVQEEEFGDHNQTTVQNEETVEPPVEGEPDLPEEGFQENIIEPNEEPSLVLGTS